MTMTMPAGAAGAVARYKDPVPLAPFLAWVNEREAVHARGDSLALTKPVSEVLAELGWSGEAGARRLHRFRYESITGLAERDQIFAALDHANVDPYDLYPDDRPDVELVDEEFCWRCRSFAMPIEGHCPWCDDPMVRIDLRGLPPRRSEGEGEEPPAWRHPEARPLRGRGGWSLLDRDLDLRRRALEAFVVTGVLKDGARTIADGNYSSVESACSSLRQLCVREGWMTRKRPSKRKVAVALKDGTWARRKEPVVERSRFRSVDDALVIDAAWLYFEDELSFHQVAVRLHHRALRKVSIAGLEHRLAQEWNLRGWPRRTARRAVEISTAGGFREPDPSRRCHGTTLNGERCRQYAPEGQRKCHRHRADARRDREQFARRASAAAYADAVPLLPFTLWLRREARKAGSVKALHRLIGEGVVSYDWLADVTGLSRAMKDRPVRIERTTRSTVDKVLAGYGNGETFEDLYLPVECAADDELIAVLASS